MKKKYIWWKTIYRLGVVNVIRNILYRIKIKVGITENETAIKNSIKSILFIGHYRAFSKKILSNEVMGLAIQNGENLCAGRYKLFFNDIHLIGSPPKWFHYDEGDFEGHWSKSPVNACLNQDIKLTWDLSRFHWLQQLCCSYKVSGDDLFLEKMNTWLKDWITKNPVNSGVNWACGQECAIRVIHVLNSTQILSDSSSSQNTLNSFVFEHAMRIESTISYAISQDNNHGTSEAAALFICGAWLIKQNDINSIDEIIATRWLNLGRKILEERIKKLVFSDGGFSMYSTNYHRVFLNTVSIVEFWRQRLSQDSFSNLYLNKCKLATEWLYALVDVTTGDTWNLGANDGSNPFIVQHSDYRDYRPSIQFSSVMFFNEKFYPNEHFINEPLDWFEIDHSAFTYCEKTKESTILFESGIVILRAEQIGLLDTVGFIKFPNFSFRPSQADLLHFDLWHEGVNILRDAGSYSYNCESKVSECFSTISAHNTVEIDGTEPMPRLGPFLFGDWSKMKYIGELIKTEHSLQWEGSYDTPSGANHYRKVLCRSNIWEVSDTVFGAKEIIVVRWRLKPGDWKLSGNTIKCDNIFIKIHSENEIVLRLSTCFESRYYNSKEDVPLLEIQVKSCDATIITSINILEK